MRRNVCLRCTIFELQLTGNGMVRPCSSPAARRAGKGAPNSLERGVAVRQGLHFLRAELPDVLAKNEWLSEPLRQPLADQASDDVGPTAWRKWHNPAHRPRRIALRPRDERHGRHCGSSRDQFQKSTAGKFHGAESSSAFSRQDGTPQESANRIPSDRQNREGTFVRSRSTPPVGNSVMARDRCTARFRSCLCPKWVILCRRTLPASIH
jgi:hypothetical protein